MITDGSQLPVPGFCSSTFLTATAPRILPRTVRNSGVRRLKGEEDYRGQATEEEPKADRRRRSPPPHRVIVPPFRPDDRVHQSGPPSTVHSSRQPAPPPPALSVPSPPKRSAQSAQRVRGRSGYPPPSVSAQSAPQAHAQIRTPSARTNPHPKRKRGVSSEPEVSTRVTPVHVAHRQPSPTPASGRCLPPPESSCSLLRCGRS